MNLDRTLLIVPTYNERENIPIIIKAVRLIAPDLHILIVDDNSPDGTANLAEEALADYPHSWVVRRTGKRGLGRSYVDGYRRALSEGYARVIQMDADYSHDPRYIPDMLSESQTADVVLGSRYCHGGGVKDWPFHRLFLSKFANFYVSAIAGLSVGDSTSGFRCYSRRALEKIQIDKVVSNGYAFQVEMTYRAKQAGLRIVECPIVFTDRTKGQSKISRKVLLESMIMPWRLRFSRNIRRSLNMAKSTVDK